MAATDPYGLEGLSAEAIAFNAKGLTPLTALEMTELTRIQAVILDEAWTEEDVRANIIDPLVRLLGYQKGDMFSAEREYSLQFLQSRRRMDYSFTLWKESFWLIEAKKPTKGRKCFDQKDLDQALLYAIHPEVNASLIMLSDGRIFEVFDRDTSIKQPVLKLEKSSLVHDFDKLRALLSPWQAWFFQKRRIIRAVDKVFDREFNFKRVDEFKDLIERRLSAKRMGILKNYQSATIRGLNENTESLEFSEASMEELVEVCLFVPQPWPSINAIAERLSANCEPGGFRLLYRLFPDKPRDANQIFWAHGLHVLMKLEEKHFAPNWLPSFLGGPSSEPRSLAPAIERLIAYCISCFEADEARKTVLLFTAVFRRIIKVWMVTDSSAARLGFIAHLLERSLGDEMTFSQIVSSPERHSLLQLDRIAIGATTDFVRRHSGESHSFRTETAKLELRQLWAFETEYVSDIINYSKVLREKNFGEVFPTEADCRLWDGLAHNSLVFIERFGRWRDYVVSEHGDVISDLARKGYWSARGILGIAQGEPCEPVSDEWAARRFFFGSVDTARRLREAYET